MTIDLTAALQDRLNDPQEQERQLRNKRFSLKGNTNKERRELFIKQTKEGMPSAEQAEYWGISTRTIYRKRKELGLSKLAAHLAYSKDVIEIDKKLFIQQVKEGMTVSQQEKYWNISRNTVSRRRKKYSLSKAAPCTDFIPMSEILGNS